MNIIFKLRVFFGGRFFSKVYYNEEGDPCDVKGLRSVKGSFIIDNRKFKEYQYLGEGLYFLEHPISGATLFSDIQHPVRLKKLKEFCKSLEENKE